MPGDLDRYRATLRNGTAGQDVTIAADCAAALAPTAETAQLLLDRLDRTLDQVRRLDAEAVSLGPAEIGSSLAQALATLHRPEGYARIGAYFSSADWHTRRDQELFDAIAARGYHRAELVEAFYLALTGLPASAGTALARACELFNRGYLGREARDEPRFVHGVLLALSRIERATGAPYATYAKDACEKTLLTQLLDTRMREAFVASFLGKLSQEERRILDRFLARVATAPTPQTVSRLTAAFFAVPWQATVSEWRRRHPDVPCEAFRGESHVTHADDLWCTRCALKRQGLEQQLYFHPNRAGNACTLQKVWLSAPSTASEAVTALATAVAARLGPPTPRAEIHGPGAAYWYDISAWQWRGREVYAFRNEFRAQGGEGLPAVEILARDPELVTAIAEEDAAERAIESERKHHEAKRSDRLYTEVAARRPDVAPQLRARVSPEARYALLLALLAKLPTTGAERAAQLYLADHLAADVGRESTALPDWEGKQRALAGYGVVYTPDRENGLTYNHLFLQRIVDEQLTGYWAEEALLDWLRLHSAEGELCTETEMFETVIRELAEVLRRQPTLRIRPQLALVLAQAHETAWSLSLAGLQDDYVNAAEYRAEAPRHRQQAIAYYEAFLQAAPAAREAVLAGAALTRLRMGVDTNSRQFYCISD